MSTRIHVLLLVAMLGATLPRITRAADNFKVTIIEPKKDASLAGKKEVIRIKYQRGRNAITSLTFLMDQQEVITDRGPFKDQEEIAFNFDTTAFADGKHRLAAKMTDAKDVSRTDEFEIEIRNKTT